MRNHRITVRLTDDEYEHLQNKAADAHINQSRFVVNAIMDKPIVIIDGVREFNKELRRIGVNVNQIATLCNMGKIKCVGLEAIQDAIDKIGADINRLRRDVKRE